MTENSADRRRSHWAWGWEDKLLGKDAKDNLGQMMGGMLGFSPSGSREPVAESAITLAKPRVTPTSDIEGFCDLSPSARIRHTKGRSYGDIVSGFYGEYGGAPDFVSFPKDEHEVAQLLAWADSRNVAVVPYGGGTSVVGGVSTDIEGYSGVVSLDTGRMSQILEVDDVSRAARIQSGILGPALESGLKKHGFTLRHFPQSFEFSTLGGWLVTRAGGHFATGPTHIDDFVESMRMVSPRGLFENRRLPASGAGPDPNRWVLGSEGTLGVVTEAWMRIQPRPKHGSQASFHFKEFKDAVNAVRDLTQSGLNPANCRLLDAREAMLNQVVFNGSHVLIVAFESTDGPRDVWMEQAEGICLAHGATCPDGITHKHDQPAKSEDSAGKWKSAFFDGPYLQSSLVTMGVIADTFETACTWDVFEEFHKSVISKMRAAMKEVCGGGFISCRFTHVYSDGPAPYYTYIAPSSFGSEISQWKELKAASMEAVGTAGGTITHHHAVGRIHRPGYDLERPDLFADMLRGAKSAVDPNSILNPGVLIDPLG